jgi:hypothetical protein
MALSSFLSLALSSSFYLSFGPGCIWRVSSFGYFVWRQPLHLELKGRFERDSWIISLPFRPVWSIGLGHWSKETTKKILFRSQKIAVVH